MPNHMIALSLENAARYALNIDSRGGLGGVIDADFIDGYRGAFTVICAALSPYYMDGIPSVREEISQIIERYDYLKDSDTTVEDYDAGVRQAAQDITSFVGRIQNR